MTKIKQRSDADRSGDESDTPESTGRKPSVDPNWVAPTALVDGKPVASHGDEILHLINPSNGRRIGEAPAGVDADVDFAVNASRVAFDDGRWRNAELRQRKAVLHRLADLIAANATMLDETDAVEMGKPVGLGFANATSAASLTRFYAEAIDKLSGDVFASDRATFVAQRRVAHGIVAAIVPWNFPTYVALLKVAPALAAGNAVVLKPSELSPSSAVRVAELALEAGLPPGVFNVVPGLGQTVGQALARHMDVDMLAFTGSTTVGKLMLQYSGLSNLKAVMVECGGKSPQILFNDGVDIDAACDAIAAFLLVNQGQICSVGSRLLVERSIEKRVVERIGARMREIVAGDALNPLTNFGPLASERQCERVMHFIDGVSEDGAEVASGGTRTLVQTGGFFVEPTVIRNVSPGARIACEEVFGPVIAVIPFDDEGEAVRIANGTIYGLKSYVWTASLARAMRMTQALRSSVTVNAVPSCSEGAGFAASSEPAGQSGFGAEGGLAGLESYLRRQQIWINHG